MALIINGNKIYEGFVLHVIGIGPDKNLAYVYDEIYDKIFEIEFQTNECSLSGGNPKYGEVRVDASPEVHEKAKKAWVRDTFDFMRNKMIEYAKRPHVGAQIEVYRGRRSQIGKTGEVTWVKTFNPGTSFKYTRLKVYDPKTGKSFFEYSTNIRVTNVDDYIPSDSSITNRLKNLADRGYYVRDNRYLGVWLKK